MMQTQTSSAQIPVQPYTERAKRHKDGSVLLSIADDRICKLNGVGALTWMILEENPEGLSVDEVVRILSEQFEAINSEGELRYDVSPEQLREDTARFLKSITAMNLLGVMTDSRGQEFYCMKEGVSGTTSATVAAVSTAVQAAVVTPVDKPAPTEGNKTIAATEAVTPDQDIKPSRHEIFTAFMALLSFDLLLKFRGFQSLIKRVENWPTAEPRTADYEACRRVRATVDRAQMFYPKKAMCLQHSAVVTCLLRRRGVPAEMVLAAQEFPVRVHAWAEVYGTVINDFQSVRARHREIRRV